MSARGAVPLWSYQREHVQWVLYFAEVPGRIQSEKKGRSYALTVADADGDAMKGAR